LPSSVPERELMIENVVGILTGDPLIMIGLVPSSISALRG
jgi:hypothetical protein